MKKLLLFLILITSQLFYSQSDCVTAIPVCGNSDLFYNSQGSGEFEEELGGCLATDERYTVWYEFTIGTSGTLTFTIDPNVFEDDYDFGVYGPNVTCGALGGPIRCNYSGADGPTGLSLTSTDPNGGLFGQWSSYMDVVAGQKYYLVIDNYSESENGFSLTWGGTATLASAFSDPALAPNPFIAPGTPAANPDDPNEIFTCLPDGSQFNLTTLSSGILNGNPNFYVTYHATQNDALTGNNPITTAIISPTNVYYYRIKYQDPVDPANPINKCFQNGKFKFRSGYFPTSNITLTECNNNGAGTATYNLTLANVAPGVTGTKKYYPTLNDMNAGTNEITNPTAYVSAEKNVYVKITSSETCTNTAVITLAFYPVIALTPATIESCYIPTNITTASFDLTTANVVNMGGITKKFYPTMADAVAGTNEIFSQTNYITISRDVYVRVFDNNGCYAITKITLVVLPPVKSTVLKDQTICIEDRTTLDAGPGFDGYEWSTGATTQSIQGVPVGAYWVKLQTGKCFTLQEVNIYPAKQPVIASLDITNNTITVTASGGTAPYQYSLDGINWQDSNVFTNLPRGENKIFLRDSYDCTPISVQVTVPNLINAITPNGDNINDEVDYSALAYKKDLVFTVYNRYGNKIYEADKMRNFKWNGTSGGKKIVTGTYWYTITWTENDKDSTQTKYTGWILVKNRD